MRLLVEGREERVRSPDRPLDDKLLEALLGREEKKG